MEEPSDDDEEVRIVRKPKAGSLKGIPPGYTPVLEELPKWGLLDSVITEVEQEIQLNPVPKESGGNNTILIMTEMDRTCTQLRELLTTHGKANSRGRKMMMHLLRKYFRWKSGYAAVSQNLFKKDAAKREEQEAKQKEAVGGKYRRGQPPNKRRRVRGGGVATATVREERTSSTTLEQEAAEIARYLDADDDDEGVEQNGNGIHAEHGPGLAITNDFDEAAFTDYFGQLDLDQLIVVRPYSGDDDDRVLDELRPRFVIMYDLDMSFVRRLEVYRSSHPGVGLRVYFLIYSGSVEEQMYLASMRKEKDAFETLIKERATMTIPIVHTGKAANETNDEFLRVANSRIAGGGQLAATGEQPRVSSPSAMKNAG